VASEWETFFSVEFPELSIAMTNAFPVVEAGEGGQRVKAKKDQRVKVSELSYLVHFLSLFLSRL
jgi:hypothetical protein